jgi:hypothetical protein
MTDDEQYDTDEPAGALTTQRGNNQIARQDFQGGSLATQNGAIDAMVAKARADVEAACIMAKRWPRNMNDVRQDVVAECNRPGFAAVALYAKPVGSKLNETTRKWEKQFAEGLSIRFAEVAMRCMGNMEATSETIYSDNSVEMIRVTVIDYERNSRWKRDISVPRTVERKQLKKGQKPLGERLNSYGDRVFIVEATDSEVAVKAAAEISKAVRTLILRVVPGNLQDEAKALVKAVAARKDAQDPAAARNKMFDAFAAIGVKPSALEEWLGHGTDSISPAEVEELRQVHTAIKEGETSWADALKEAKTERDGDAPATKSATNGGVPPTPAATPQGPPPGVPAIPAEPAKPREPTSPADLPRTGPRTSSGKGTTALKGALTSKPAPAAPPTVQQAMPMADLPPGTPSPADGNEYRACAGCSDTIEVPKTDPPGALCDSCSSAGRSE